MAIDQAHEQNNALVKGDGGAVGLTEDVQALRRWMISGPEIARIVHDFEESLHTDPGQVSPKDIPHHEQKRAVQNAFSKSVKGLALVIEEMGNPFSEESQDLLVLDNRNII